MSLSDEITAFSDCTLKIKLNVFKHSGPLTWMYISSYLNDLFID